MAGPCGKKNRARAVPESLHGKHIGHADAVLAAHPLQSLRLRRHAAHGFDRGERHHQLFLPGLHPQGSVADIALIDAQRLGQNAARFVDLTPGRRWSGQCPAVALCAHADHARRHFQAQRLPSQPKRPANMRRPQGRMSRERHLVGRRENPHARVGARGGQNERGLGQIELPGQRLHDVRVETRAVLEHAQWIAAQRCRDCWVKTLRMRNGWVAIPGANFA